MKAFVLGLLLLVGAMGAAKAEPWPRNVSYSADLLIGRDHPKMGKIWRTPIAYRQETGERQPVIILRLDRNLAWVLAGGSVLVEVDFTRTGLVLDAILSGRDLNPKAEAAEAVDGVATTRYHVHFNHDPVANFDGTVWISKDGVVMRIAGEGAFGGQNGRVDVEARNVKLGRQPDSLFAEPPASMRMKIDAASAAQVLQSLGNR